MLSLRQRRLPRARRMLERVNSGAILREGEISFLRRVLRDIRANQSLIFDHADLLHFVSEFMDLYQAIVSKAMENERAGGLPVSDTQADAG